MVRTQIQLTEEQAERLKRRAAEEGASLAEIVRRGIDAYLERGAGTSAEDRRRRATEAIGRFASGAGDLSERHDDHLAEAYQA